MQTRATGPTADPNAVSRGLANDIQIEPRSRWVAAGAVLGAIAASSCCIVPLLLFSVGVSGAWIGALTAMEPYRPAFVAIAAGFLGYGFWLAYRKPASCDGEVACAGPLPSRVVKMALWVSAALVLLATFWNQAAPVIAPILLGL